MVRFSSVLLALSFTACHPASTERGATSTPRLRVDVPASPLPTTPEPLPRRATYDEYMASLVGTLATAQPTAPPPPKPDHERFPEEVAEARRRVKAALDAASLGRLRLSETMFPVRETADGVTWRFALMDPASCEGACRELDEGEQVGWMLAPVEGEASVEALGHVHDLAAFARVRAREKQQAVALAKRPVMGAFCRWVVQQGAEGCTMWIEEAPASDCRRSCQWQVYVGASNGVASSRHFTLLIDEKTGALTVRGLDGHTEPMATYRAKMGF